MGGHFDYIQYQMVRIKEAIEKEIEENNAPTIEACDENYWTGFYPHNYSEETINSFKETVALLDSLYARVNHIDSLLSGDINETDYLKKNIR